jgi:hypothetical protein
MKRLIVSVMVAMALLTAGIAVTQHGFVGTAYADGGDGGGD